MSQKKKLIHPEVAIVIPVYNEATVIRGVLEEVLKNFSNIICVNDGSRDNSSKEISMTTATLIEHPINMGQGAALQTGIEFGLQSPIVEYFVTFDADGQHTITDVKKMLDLIKAEKLDIVLGSRFLGKTEDMNTSKRIILKLAIRFTNIFSNVTLTDTHNGLRVFNRKFAEALNITMPDMAHASEIIDKMGRGEWKYKEVPITITYTDYSKAKGQSIINSINILFDLFMTKARKK